jgi:pimeloyl-ACP methyl ester carboxylesterase
METTALDTVQVDGLKVGYREQGEGPAVLLLHGWPTSSYLWRDVMPPIAARNRVIAPDLPGFGVSDKPLDVTYDVAFFERAIDGLLEAVRTLVDPARRDELTSRDGMAELMKLALADESRATDDLLAAVHAPFESEESREALAKAGTELGIDAFVEIEQRLPELRVPVRIVYGERDRALPDVAETMARAARDLPQAQVTALPDCGHFLQEEEPDQVGELLAEFFA